MGARPPRAYPVNASPTGSGKNHLDVRCSMFDVGCWMLDVGCWTLDVGRWTLDVGRWMLDVGRWMLDVGCSMFDVRCSMFDVLPYRTLAFGLSWPYRGPIPAAHRFPVSRMFGIRILPCRLFVDVHAPARR